MSVKFAHTVIVVRDINRSRTFYESVIGIGIVSNFGACVVFEGGLVIHSAREFNDLIRLDDQDPDKKRGANNIDIYFESNRLEEEYGRLKNEDIVFIHGIEKQSWGQRVFRFYDPDNHVVEIGEPSFVSFD